MEYGLHFANVATGELALPVLFYAWVRSKAKAVSEISKNFSHTQIYYNIFQKSLHVVNTALAINYINLC